MPSRSADNPVALTRTADILVSIRNQDLSEYQAKGGLYATVEKIMVPSNDRIGRYVLKEYGERYG
jgi:hypothetical protein